MEDRMRKYALTLLAGIFLLGGWWGEDRPGYDQIKKTFDQYLNVTSWQTAGLCGGLAVMVSGDVPYWIDRDGTVYAVSGYTRVISSRLPWGPTIASSQNVETAIKNKNQTIPSEWGDYPKLSSSTLPVNEQSMVKRMNDILKGFGLAAHLEPLTPGGERAPGWYHTGSAPVDVQFKHNSTGLARVSILAKGRGENNSHFSTVALAATAATITDRTPEEAGSILMPLFKWAKEHNGETAFGILDQVKYSFTVYGQGEGNFMRYEIEVIDPS
jgi:hypothetical protein